MEPAYSFSESETGAFLRPCSILRVNYGVAVSQEWPEGIIFCVVLIASNNGREILQGLKSRASNVLNLLSVIANGGKGGEK